MSLDPALRDDLAAKLADARADRTPCALETALGHRLGAKGLGEEEAYQIQQALVEVELARGERLVGAKVGPGTILTAGMVVLTGAMAPPQVITAGDVFEADFKALGRLGVRFRASAREPSLSR